MMEFLNWVVANWDTIGQILTGIVTTASAVAAVTPTPKRGLGKSLYGVIDMLALNVGRAKDK